MRKTSSVGSVSISAEAGFRCSVSSFSSSGIGPILTTRVSAASGGGLGHASPGVGAGHARPIGMRAIIVVKRGSSMSDKGQMAVDKFMEGYNCAQSVVFAFCEECGSAGCGAQGSVRFRRRHGPQAGGVRRCDGRRHGPRAAARPRHARGPPVTEALYPMTREFMDGFAVRNGSYLCRDLLSGCELTSEEGQRQFKERGLLEKVCKPCVRSAAELLGKLKHAPPMA